MMQPEERREAPRYQVNLSGTATTNTGYRCNVQVTNISATGLQFTVAQLELSRMIPKFAETGGVQPITITLDIDILDQQSPIKIRCGIVYVQRTSMTLGSVGCRFELFNSDSSRRLEKYLSRTFSLKGSPFLVSHRNE